MRKFMYKMLMLIMVLNILSPSIIIANDRYADFRPNVADEEADNAGFLSLQEVNSDVFGWITVFGTNIDYPLVQDASGDNRRYEHTNARGEPAMTGAIFLDVRNNLDLGDFNNIIYGHEMARGGMFGDLYTFMQPAVFEAHPFGMIYSSVTDQFYGIEFFAFMLVNALDTQIYNPFLTNDSMHDELIDRIFSEAIQSRPINITRDDRLVILSTCTPVGTQNRHILIGRLTDEIQYDAFYMHNTQRGWGAQLLEEFGQIRLVITTILIIILTICATILFARFQTRKEIKDATSIPPKKKQKKATLLAEVVFLFGKITLVLTAAIFLFVFVFGATQVNDASMAPLVREGDIVFFRRGSGGLDISVNVVVLDDGQPKVRRIVAVEGDVVDITYEGLVINGRIQHEVDIFGETTQFVEGVNFPLTVGYGEVFILGDNRRQSRDSRVYGPVTRDNILGSVVTVIRRRNI